MADGWRGTFEATCLVVRKCGAPTGVKPMEWPLLTNRIAELLAGVVELTDWDRVH